MHTKLLVLFALVSVVRNHDVIVGLDGGRKIFEDTRFASPAIWRQVENVTVIAPINEVISKVNITDMRADKDGDVDIVNGGEGEQSVTMELKSPTVLRGYEFHIEVFSVPKSNYKVSENADKAEEIPEDILDNEYKTTTPPQNNDSENSDTNISTSIEKDSNALRPARETNDENDITKSPEETETTITSTETLYKDTTITDDYPSIEDIEEKNDRTTESVEGSGNEENSATVIPPEWLRPVRGVDSEHDLTEMSVETEAAITNTETFNEDYTTIDYIPDEGVYNIDSTTEVIEVVPIDPAARPARETNNENESTVTESLNKETTEGTSKANDDDNTMITPNTYVKENPDYSALSILEYIKNREQGGRKARRFGVYDYTQSPDEEQTNGNEDSSSTENSYSTNKSDDTVDLVPPKIDAPYNDKFAPDFESTEEPIESSTSEVTTASDTRDESSTPMSEDATTESSLEEKSRNSRNTEDNLENSNSFDLTSETETTNNITMKNNLSTGIVLLKGNHIIITADGKQREFILPIVLIIGNENNFPMFKLVEDSNDVEKKDLDTESSLNDTPDITMDYEASDDTSDAAGDGASDSADDVAKNEEYSY